MTSASAPGDKPIRDAIKVRQREAARQTAEMKRTSGIEILESRPIVEPPAPAKTVNTVMAVPPQTTTRTTQAVENSKRATRTLDVLPNRMGWTRRRIVMLFIALFLVGVIFLGVGLLTAGNALQGASPTFVPLPVVQASDIMTHLRQIGLTLGDIQTLTVPNTTWAAHQEMRFTVQHDTDRGTFIVLSYPSAALAGNDAFRAHFDKTWHTWPLVQLNNILFLAAPDTAPRLTAQLDSHLTSFLIAPYRPGLPTATPGTP